MTGDKGRNLQGEPNHMDAFFVSVLLPSPSQTAPNIAVAQSIHRSLPPLLSCSWCLVAGSGETVRGRQDALELIPCRSRRLGQVR
jgi:hypothetical protein